MTFSSPEMAAVGAEVPAADLVLRFARSVDGRSYIDHQFGRYPFHVCRAHYLDVEPAGMATVYLQSSSGGIFAHDRLSCHLQVNAGASAHVTSQASTVVHRMDDAQARYRVDIRAEGDATFEYLPDPLILFPKSRLHSSVVVRKAPRATVVLADAFIAHDPAQGGNERFSALDNEIRIEDLDGRLLALDRNRFTGADFAGGNVGVLGRRRALGTFMVLSTRCASAALCDGLREALAGHGDVFAGVSALPNGAGVWARLASEEILALRAAVHDLWRQARLALFGTYPCERRK